MAKKYAVADMITGYGVSESVKHFYEIFKSTSLEGKRTIIQGWGNVASAAAYYLALNGAKIVGIIDRDGGIIDQDGLSLRQVEELFSDKKGNKLNAEEMISFDEANVKIWDLEAEIFIPGAASKIVSRSQIIRLMDKGLETISCGDKRTIC